MQQFRFSRARRVSVVLFALCLVASLAGWTHAWGQANEGAIAGTIVDATGAVVANAQITAVGENTGVKYHATSTAAGVYNIPSMGIGPYDVTVTAAGFKKQEQTGVVVQVGTTTALTIKLQVGAATETVVVASNAPSLETETADIGVVMSEQQTLDLPLPLGGAVQYMREPESFVFLVPGTVGPGTSGGSGGTFESKINGGQGYSTEVLLDGSSTYRSENGSSFSETSPSVDALSDFKLTTSTLQAYMGRTTGGIESFNTKGGTNSFHGNAYDIIANTDFDANNWGNNLALALIKSGARTGLSSSNYQRVADKQNDYGLTFGGPVRIPYLYNGHDKTFFFFSWEQFKMSSGGVSTITVPTDAERSGDFSSLLTTTQVGTDPCTGNPIYEGEIFDPNTETTVGSTLCRTPFSGNKISSGYTATGGSSTIGQAIMSYIPKAQTSGLTDNYTYSYAFPTLATSMSVRLDQNLKNNQKTYFTYNSRDNVRLSTTPIWQNAAGDGRHQNFFTHYIRWGYDVPIGTTMLNHLNLGYNRTNSMNTGAAVRYGGNYDDKLGIANGGNGGGRTFPNVNFSDGKWTSFGDSVDGDTIDNGYRLNEAVDWIKGKHSFKFGWDYRYQVFDPINTANQSGTLDFSSYTTAGTVATNSTSGLAEASLYLGLIGNGTSTTAYATQPKWVYSYWALFAQDDWKIAPRLTIDYGFRYDVDVPRRNTKDNTSDIDLDAPNSGAGGLPGALVFAGIGAGRTGVTGETWAKTWRHDWGPRLGFAWTPKLPGNLSDKTVVHGGYGIYYAALTMADFGGDMLTGFQANPSWSNGDNFDPAFNLGSGFPAYAAPPNLDPTQLNYGYPAYVAPDHGRPAMIQNWSFDVQEQLAKDMLLDVGYVGEHSTHLHSGFDATNSMTPGNLSYGSLLGDSITSTAAVAAGFTLPYSSYPTGNSVGNRLRPMPQYYSFNTDCCLENRGQSSFNALEVSVQRRWRDSLNLLASYTWSKTLTDADSALPYFASSQGGGSIQNPFNDKGEKALSNQDLPQVLVISYIYQLPFGKGRKFLNQNKVVDEVVGGWQLGGLHRYQSGQPISFGDPETAPGFDGQLRYNRVSGQSLGSSFKNGFNPAKQPEIFGGTADEYSTSNPNPYRYFNYAALTDPNSSTLVSSRGTYIFGNMTRTTGEIRSFKYLTEDFSMIKRFPIIEGVKLELKAELIDAFNRHIFNRPDTDGPSDAFTFGYVNPTAMDNGNINGEPGDGGPRRVQFTLKTEF